MRVAANRFLRGVCVALAGVAWMPLASAADYYVAPTGSDTNPGTNASPWRQVSFAASRVSAADTVHVAPGTYSGPIVVPAANSGSSGNRIRFVSDAVKWGAAVVGGNPAFLVRGDYVDVIGFDISTSSGNIGIELNGNAGRALGNRVHDVNIADICNAGGAGIATTKTSASNNVVIGNWVHNIGDPTLGCASVHGIYIQNPTNTVENNVVSRAMGWGISSFHAATSNIIANNTVLNNNVGGINTGANGTAPEYFPPDQCTAVFNNLVFGNGTYPSSAPSAWPYSPYSPNRRFGFTQEASYVNVGPNANVFAYNMAYGNWGCRRLDQPYCPLDQACDCGAYDYNDSSPNPYGGSSAVIPVHENVSLPQSWSWGQVFVNWQYDGTGDYHLSSESLATAKGAPGLNVCGRLAVMPYMDFDGVARTCPGDLGAYAASGTPGIWPAYYMQMP